MRSQMVTTAAVEEARAERLDTPVWLKTVPQQAPNVSKRVPR